MKSAPLVSIIVPTKNSSTTLEKCLTSINEQTYPAIELIVVDNNSADNTKEIAKKYTKIVLNKTPERNLQRNFGAKHATGDYLVFIDSDMDLAPKIIEECMELMNANKEVVGVTIPERSFGVGFWAQCKVLERQCYEGIPWMEGARFFRRSTFELVKGYDETMISGEDWDLSQRIESHGKLARSTSYIMHNEGKLSITKTVQKKFYYARLFKHYSSKNKNNANTHNQTNIIKRYSLFFRRPSLLVRNPIITMGMLFMKTAEFTAGAAGLLVPRKET